MPSILHKINTHINIIENIKKLLPVTKVILETGLFDIAKMENDNIRNYQYQKGEMITLMRTIIPGPALSARSSHHACQAARLRDGPARCASHRSRPPYRKPAEDVPTHGVPLLGYSTPSSPAVRSYSTPAADRAHRFAPPGAYSSQPLRQRPRASEAAAEAAYGSAEPYEPVLPGPGGKGRRGYGRRRGEGEGRGRRRVDTEQGGPVQGC